jgi:hypothetical protein
MAKIRRSKARSVLVAPEVLAEAAILFARGLQLQALGADDIGDGYERAPEQLEYAAVEKRLHWTLLDLVGSAGPLDVSPGMERGGSEYYKTSYPRALAIRALLMKEIGKCSTKQKRSTKNGVTPIAKWS